MIIFTKTPYNYEWTHPSDKDGNVHWSEKVSCKSLFQEEETSGSAELQIRGGIEDNSDIFSYFLMKAYIVASH